ncbi:MAG TPA: response regulator [Candidatus Brocadiia bacterium]|nr:response regulator [Candidatus Brocadiia bacterium]
MTDSRQRLIVVDDEASIRRSLAAYLEDEGYAVDEAASAEEGLAMIHRTAPGLAIVDMRLPGMDGHGFIRQAHDLLPAMKFIICTGSSGYTLPPAIRAIGLLPQHVFRKPLADLAELGAAVRDMLQAGVLP